MLFVLLIVAGCKTKSYPIVEYMPDMYHQISLKAQEYDPTAPGGVGMRQPVAGTIPRGYEPYPYAFADTVLADQMVNPLLPTADVLEVGKKYFNSYCIVCHGERGDGLGFIVPKFTQPPPLFSEKLLRWPDGRIYHTISLGQGLMSSYASQLLPEQRWAVVNYVRALQRAAHPTEDDLAIAKQSEAADTMKKP